VRRKARRSRISLPAAVLAVAGLMACHVAVASAATTVSLTFDDGTASQYQARPMLAAHGMRGTFYVNSSRVGTSGYYMTWSQIHDLADDGNEIGGHTAHHVDLPNTDPTEAQREICLDRDNLLDQGFAPRNFAYPFGSFNAAVQTMVRNCGYNSARTTTQAVADTIPPRDPYAIIESSGSSSLAALKNAVIAGENAGGGWVTIVFHQLCNACDTNWVLPSDLDAFLDWLQPRAAQGTVVKTVDEVVGGPLQAAVPPPAPPPAPNGWNGIHNASLEIDGNGDSIPDCHGFDTFGQNTYKFMRTSDAHTGSWAERLDITNYRNGDAKLVQAGDLGVCTPTVTPGHRYKVTAWYKSTSPVMFTAFARSTAGVIDFWTSSSSFSTSSSWTQATWTTPVVPNGINGITFGLTLSANGTLTVDDLGIDDAAPTGSDTTQPSASLTAPSAGAVVSGATTLSAAVSDNVAIDHVDFLIDGSVTATRTSGPFSVSWNSRTVANGSHTIAVRAVDLAGNVRTTGATTVTVSNNFTNLLQNPSLETATLSTPTCWLLGGFGANTFTWTRTTDAHSGLAAEKLDITAYTDGDRKMVSTQDTGACAPPVIPGHTYTATAYYKSSAPARLFAYYRSGTGAWTFWTSATFPASSTWTKATWVSPAVPAGATNASIGMGMSVVGSVTMDDFELFDNAPPPDTTAPTSSIVCNTGGDGGGCTSSYYNAPVDVGLSATDDAAGSGVKEIRYTTDGSDPTATSGTVYAGPFSVMTTATVKWRAFDNAGNTEAVRSQLIRIDTTAPTATLLAPSNGAMVAANVTLTASAGDNSGVDRVEFLVDGELVGSQAAAPYDLVWDSTTVADGPHAIQARAIDVAGNATTSTAVSITVSNGAPPSDTEPPSSAIACNQSACAAGYYGAPVTVTLSALDTGGSGLKEIRYTTDGSDPTTSTGTVYGAPFSVATTSTVKFRAFDNAGNAEAVQSQLIRVDVLAPVSSISCDGAACGSGYSGSTVSVALSAVDEAGGSGLKEIRYTTDGSDPTALTGTVYGAPFSVATTSTVKFRAVDNAGNAEAVQSQLIRVDTTPPSAALTSPADGATLSGTAALSASAADDSGVDHVEFLVDGQVIGSDTTAPYTLSWDSTVVSDGAHVLRARAVDLAANATTSAAVNVTVTNVVGPPPDTTAPTSSIACNATACNTTGWYAAAVSVSLTATDTGGSGVKEIRYSTDGSDPTATTGTVYAGPFSVAATTTVKWRAFDNAGNAEAVRSQLVQIDTTAPTVAITAPANGASVTASVKITTNAADSGSGVAKVTFYVDGTVLATVTATPFNTNWNTKKSTKGQHVLTAVAEDRAGNRTTSAPVTVTVR
jgi:peptidoglycan/xylan/chitin deacetylase (PgdA/CDA1 family)